uniref:Uncharacterized protein n=1 Tax=Megaselia scalaris TaxID=36166 RepID=T1GQ27_MEGSC
MEKQTIDDVETKLEALFAESPGKSKTPSTDENVEQKTPEKQNPKIEKEPQTKPAVKKRRRKAKQKSQIKKKFAQQDQEKAQITNKFKKQQHQKPPEDSYKGPFIQFKKDGFFTVVNSSTAVDEDSEKQGSSKSKKQIYDKTKIRSFNVSTLSHKYDADKTDKTWVCVYCKNGPHKQNLVICLGLML